MSIKGKATSLDIAHLAGVSQPTVSRALRNSPLVSEETREKVQRIARELNYKVDKNASNLRCQTSGTLALLLFEDPSLDDSLINPFFVSMLSSITRACGQRSFDLLISFQQLSDDWHADYEDSKKADGLILLGYGDYLEYQARLDQLVAQSTHFVRWGAVLPGQPGISIGSDNRQGGRDITAHLIGQGRSRIAFIGNATDHYPEFFGRYRGYLDALEAAGITAEPLLQVDARQSAEEAGQEAVANLLKRGVPFDAIFAASDLIAIGAMRALRERGMDIPGDVAVAGFDDLPMAAMANPALTTVQQDTRLAGQVLVDTLIASIRGEEVQARTIPTRLAIRSSCGAA
jgi:DNA-binding LacI/PurR family transcriptional regulator